MQKIITETGFGYIKDSEDKIVCKCVISKNREHDMKDGYTFVELEKEADLATVVVAPREKTNDMLHAELLQKELIAMGDERLKEKGLIDDKGIVIKGI